MVERSIVTETGTIPPPVAGQLVEPGDPPSEQQGCEPQRRNKEVASGGPWAAKRADPSHSALSNTAPSLQAPEVAMDDFELEYGDKFPVGAIPEACSNQVDDTGLYVGIRPSCTYSIW